jgi:ABC-2 type transport system permease protein
MNKIWLVFKYEYVRHVLRKRFLVALVSMPLFFGVIIGISILASMASIDRSPVGFIDQSGMFSDLKSKDPSNSLFDVEVAYLRYSDKSQADADLHAKKIQAYYVIAEDYAQTGKAQLVYLEKPGNSIQNDFENLIRQKLVAAQPTIVLHRLEDGSHLTIESADGTRRLNEGDWFNLVLLFCSGILFIVVVFTSSGYLMHSMVEEKENRTMEIIVTSISPEQLMTGKVLGNLSVGLTQLLVWMGCIVLAILIGQQSIDWMQNIEISNETIQIFALIMLPGFVMIAGLMAMLGASVSEVREAQQWTSLISLPVVAPYWLFGAISSNPNSVLAIGLSFFPLTAPVTLSIRVAIAIIPLWQIILSSALVSLCAVGSIWLAARAFRFGMIRYGKKVALKELLGKAG